MKLEWIDNIEAVFFDMDGTLLDSEPLTELAISKLLHRFEICKVPKNIPDKDCKH